MSNIKIVLQKVTFHQNLGFLRHGIFIRLLIDDVPPAADVEDAASNDDPKNEELWGEAIIGAESVGLRQDDVRLFGELRVSPLTRAVKSSKF